MITSRVQYQLHGAIFLALSLFVGSIIGFWHLTGRKGEAHIVLESVSSLEERGLLSSDSDPVARRRFLKELADLEGVDLAFFDAEDRLIDSVSVRGGQSFNGIMRPTIGILLRNGSRIEVAGFSQTDKLFTMVKLVVPLGVLIAVLCYPLVRRLTRRLEDLQSSVAALGSGDLTVRVKVEGRDEVARLAQSFNSAAAQIEKLVGAHKLLLANVSHELRTPLSRLRLTTELLKEIADPKRKADLEQDVTEIDVLIEQILLTSRLDVVGELNIYEDVDLLALAAEESVRCRESDVTGSPVIVRGDPALLRRMIRNLIENAQKHGSPPIEIRVYPRQNDAILTVSDSGDGIPSLERERAFAPFYRPPGTHSQGFGLGLALVRQIARQHGGEADAAAAPASTIEVRLPAVT